MFDSLTDKLTIIIWIQPDELRGLREAEYVEIIRYIVVEYEQQNTYLHNLTANHERLHSLYEVFLL
jgi:hypothetical protein